MCKLKPKQNRKTTKRCPPPPSAPLLALIWIAPGNWPVDLTAVCTPSRLRLKSGWALPVCWIFNFSIVLKDGTHSVLHLWPLAVAYFRAHANVTLLCHTHTHTLGHTGSCHSTVLFSIRLSLPLFVRPRCNLKWFQQDASSGVSSALWLWFTPSNLLGKQEAACTNSRSNSNNNCY